MINVTTTRFNIAYFTVPGEHNKTFQNNGINTYVNYTIFVCYSTT